MKLIFIAGREQSYARVNIILKGLKKNKIRIKECLSSSKSAIIRYIAVILKFIFMKKNDCDGIFVGFFGQPLVPLIKIFTKKKIIFDSFLSSYDTMVFDKKVVKKGSLLAKFFWHLDRVSCRLADKVLLDTNEHINYFASEFGINKDKMERILIGADDTLFNPSKQKKVKNKSNRFIVEFHGNFIPLQGTEYIIKAAKILEKNKDIQFLMIGKGQTFDRCLRLTKSYGLKNVTFLGNKKPNEIPLYIYTADIGLGIFGSTQKTLRVIPNKAYEVLAMKRPLLTSNTPAALELFEHKKNAFLCNRANPMSLAKAILYLKENKAVREKIAKNGYNLFKKECTPKVLGEKIKDIIADLNNSY